MRARPVRPGIPRIVQKRCHQFLSGTDGAVVRDNFKNPQSKHHGGHKRQGKQKARACADTARTDKSLAADLTEGTRKRGEVKCSEPLVAVNLVKNTGEENQSGQKCDVGTRADLLFLHRVLCFVF